MRAQLCCAAAGVAELPGQGRAQTEFGHEGVGGVSGVSLRRLPFRRERGAGKGRILNGEMALRARGLAFNIQNCI